jgi:hypothetical protein
MSLVHGSWTTGTPVHHRPASIAGRRSSLELGLWPFQGSRPMTKGRGGVVAHGKLDGPLTGDRAASRRPGDRGSWWWANSCGGSAPMLEMRHGGWCGVW